MVYTGKARCTIPDFLEETLSSPKGWRYRYRLIDMRTICEQLLNLDTPDAVVLTILCDFKERNEQEVVGEILHKRNTLTGGNVQLLGKYLTMLEKLAENRNLQQLVKEVEQMLSDMNLEKLPSFELGVEKGMANVRVLEQAAERKGEQKNKHATAKTMIAKDFEFSLIHEITGLSLAEIQQLAHEAK